MLHLLYTFLYWGALITNYPSLTNARLIAKGHLPVITADAEGRVHLVYGQDSTIHYAMLNGQSKPLVQTVAVLSGLVAVAKRGSQLALTGNSIVITAVNRAGNLFAYSREQKTNQWSTPTRINDVPEVAKEGFQAVAGTASSTVYAA